jgi:SAM-dependent methyltransferase
MKNSSSHCQFEIDPSALKVNDYNPIAPVFDVAFGDDFADVAFEPICRRIDQYFALDCRIKHLDLCCGTGTFLCRMAKARLTQSFGIDLSAALIGVARKKARKGKRNVQFVCGDVLSKPFPINCDLVTMNLDALNHIRSIKAWTCLSPRFTKA